MAIPIITIDGPSGTGKGTLAARLARLLGWHMLDSGALYRVVGYVARHRQVALDQADQLSDIARSLALEFRLACDSVQILVNDEDVTEKIRSEIAGSDASEVAAIPAVREALLVYQRECLRPPGLVADGRDMGTVVFTTAALKIFLTASPEVRAQRRYKQLKQKGIDVNLARLSEDIAARDRRDEQRTVSPLRPASDAIILDTTALNIASVEEAVKVLAQEHGWL
ncbi:MAG: (d)CMP kinase [Proteobacteria bacterium]|nr:(d)CMP kinase [Pseudomonadota bacterium]